MRVSNKPHYQYRKYSVQELRLRPLPDTVDPIRLETYLTDADFQVRSCNACRRIHRIEKLYV